MNVTKTNFQQQPLEKWFTIKDSPYQYLIRYLPREAYLPLLEKVQSMVRTGELESGKHYAYLFGEIIRDWRGHDVECNVDNIFSLLCNDLAGDFHSHCEAILLLCMEVSNFRDTAILLKNLLPPSNGSLTTAAPIMNAA